MVSYEEFGEIKFGMGLCPVAHGWAVTCQLPPGTGTDFSSPCLSPAWEWGHPLLRRAEGWWDLQECVLVAVLQETLTISLQSTSPGWVFPPVQVKVHPLLLRCCCFPQPCPPPGHVVRWGQAQPRCAVLPAELTLGNGEYRSPLLNATSLNYFFFLFPLLGAAEPPWQLVYVWQCLLLLGMLKIPSTVFPFHIPKYINVLLLWLVISSPFVPFVTG